MMPSVKVRSAVILLASAVSGVAAHAQSGSSAKYSADSASAVAAVERYQEALRTGERAAAVSLLDSSVVILESGELESRQEYIDHHLAADMAFAKAVASRREVKAVTVKGNVAWVASTNRSLGTFRDRRIDSDGAELMVLSRDSRGWKIAAIHWSSRTKAAKKE